MKRRKVRLKARSNNTQKGYIMSEGLPSILDIIAPGKTGLSEEGWIKAVELMGRRVRSEMEKVSLSKLADAAFGKHLHPIEDKLIGGDPITLRFFLTKQGLYFHSIVRMSPIRWLVWGVCREDSLWSLTRFTEIGNEDCDALDENRKFRMDPIQGVQPPEILERLREFEGQRFNYFKMCEMLASFGDNVYNQRVELLGKAALGRAKFQADLEVLRLLKG
jgi:hypothetical protein